MSWTIIAAGIGLLVIVAAGVMILWVADARRADRVASDPERVDLEQDAPDQQTPRRRR